MLASRPVRIAALSIAGLGLGLAAAWLAGSAMVRPLASESPPAKSPARDVDLWDADGSPIAGTFWPGAAPYAPAVLLLHGNGESRAQVAANAAWLAGQGYAALSIDFRGHGQSARAARSFGFHEAKDAVAAFKWLKARQRGAPVAVIGVSLGGAAALLPKEGPLPAEALVLQAVYPDIRRAVRNRIAARLGLAPAWALEPLLSFQSRLRFGVWPSRLAPIRALARYRGPVMIIGGEEDRCTPAHETQALHAAAADPRALWIVPRLDHDEVADLTSDEHRRRLAEFLRQTIGAP